MLRAWVMIVRNRTDGDFKDLEEVLGGLFPEFTPEIRYIHTVYGHYDVVIVIETETLHSLHDFIQVVQRLARKHARSTTTFLAIMPDSDSFGSTAEGRWFPIGINCQPRQQENIQAALDDVPEVAIADIVLGTFDLIALVRRPEGKGGRGKDKIHELLNKIARIKGVTKTTTMLDCERLDP